MKYLFPVALLLVYTLPAQSQTIGDTVVVEGENLKAGPSFDSEKKGFVEEGTRGVITAGPQNGYYRVDLAERQGWIYEESLGDLQLQRTLKEARNKGHTVFLVFQDIQKSSVGDIDVSLGIANISDEKTVKYVDATWQLFNPVGDPVEEGLNSSIAETQIVGPLKPGETASSTFDGVWNSNVGECVVLRKLVVQHIDGSSFTYINDLRDVVGGDGGVRLRGDCSYEAQQKRKDSK